MRRNTATEKKKKASQKETTLRELEEKVAQKGIQIHYDKLETAGLKLKGGLCKLRGQIHLYIDRRKSLEEKIAILTECYMEPVPDLPESLPHESSEDNQ